MRKRPCEGRRLSPTTNIDRRITMNVPVNGAGLHILIAEDYPDCAESTAMVLRLFGHNVTIAVDGPTALEMARTDKPDVVLLDLSLPGMSGYEVARQLS